MLLLAWACTSGDTPGGAGAASADDDAGARAHSEPAAAAPATRRGGDAPTPAPSAPASAAEGRAQPVADAGAPARDTTARSREPTNLRVLAEDTSRKELKRVMRAFNKALAVKCSYCHVKGDRAADTPEKEIARRMMRMVETINATYMKDTDSRVDCYTCHRGEKKPSR